MATDWTTHRTERLVLTRPALDDLDDWHSLHTDPRVWTHFPSGRYTDIDQSRSGITGAIAEWESDGLGYWSIRVDEDGPLIGTGGCRGVAAESRWNLYYRFTPEAHGNGYATELARAAIDAANDVRPDWPVVAYMLEHNEASWRVAERLGMHRIWVGPDAGNPDPAAVRYVYADRIDESTDGIGRA